MIRQFLIYLFIYSQGEKNQSRQWMLVWSSCVNEKCRSNCNISQLFPTCYSQGFDVVVQRMYGEKRYTNTLSCSQSALSDPQLRLSHIVFLQLSGGVREVEGHRRQLYEHWTHEALKTLQNPSEQAEVLR